MERNQPVLAVGSSSHFLGASHEDAHLAGAYFRKQVFLFCFGVGVMDKGDFLGWYASGNQFGANIVIHTEPIHILCQRFG